MIINEQKYEAGRIRNIKANARKTGKAKWFARETDAQRIEDWLFQSGEFAKTHVTKNPADQKSYDAQVKALWADANENNYDPHADLWLLDEKFETRLAIHPATEGMFVGKFGEVLFEMRDAILEWGGLTEKQHAMVRKALERKLQWVKEAEERKAERKAELAGSEYVGEVKQRMVFTLKVNKVLSFEGQFGMTYIHLCEDADDNQIVYKGSKRFAEGDLTVKATVKSHEERDGVKQTLIARPAEV